MNEIDKGEDILLEEYALLKEELRYKSDVETTLRKKIGQNPTPELYSQHKIVQQEVFELIRQRDAKWKLFLSKTTNQAILSNQAVNPIPSEIVPPDRYSGTAEKAHVEAQERLNQHFAKKAKIRLAKKAEQRAAYNPNTMWRRYEKLTQTAGVSVATTKSTEMHRLLVAMHEEQQKIQNINQNELLSIDELQKNRKIHETALLNIERTFEQVFGIKRQTLADFTFASSVQTIMANRALDSHSYLVHQALKIITDPAQVEAFMAIDISQYMLPEQYNRAQAMLALGIDVKGKPLSDTARKSLTAQLESLQLTETITGQQLFVPQSVMTGVDGTNKVSHQAKLYSKNPLLNLEQAEQLMEKAPNTVLIRTNITEARHSYLLQQINRVQAKMEKVRATAELVRASDKKTAMDLISKLRSQKIEIDTSGLPLLSDPTITTEEFGKALYYRYDEKATRQATQALRDELTKIQELKNQSYNTLMYAKNKLDIEIDIVQPEHLQAFLTETAEEAQEKSRTKKRSMKDSILETQPEQQPEESIVIDSKMKASGRQKISFAADAAHYKNLTKKPTTYLARKHKKMWREQRKLPPAQKKEMQLVRKTLHEMLATKNDRSLQKFKDSIVAGHILSMPGDAANIEIVRIIDNDTVTAKTMSIIPSDRTPVSFYLDLQGQGNLLADLASNLGTEEPETPSITIAHTAEKIWVLDKTQVVEAHANIQAGLGKAQLKPTIFVELNRNEIINELNKNIQSEYNRTFGVKIPSIGAIEEAVLSQAPWLKSLLEPTEIPNAVYMATVNALESLKTTQIDPLLVQKMTPENFIASVLLKPVLQEMYGEYLGSNKDKIDNVRRQMIESIASELKYRTGKMATPHDIVEYIKSVEEVIGSIEGYRPLLDIPHSEIASTLGKRSGETISIHGTMKSQDDGTETQTLLDTLSDSTDKIENFVEDSTILDAKNRLDDIYFNTVRKLGKEKADSWLATRFPDIKNLTIEKLRKIKKPDELIINLMNQYHRIMEDAGRDSNQYFRATISEFLAPDEHISFDTKMSLLAHLSAENLPITEHAGIGFKDALSADTTSRYLKINTTTTKGLEHVKNSLETINANYFAEIIHKGQQRAVRFIKTTDKNQIMVETLDDRTRFLVSDSENIFPMQKSALRPERMIRRKATKENIAPQERGIIRSFPHQIEDLSNMYDTRIGANAVDSLLNMQEYADGKATMAIFDYETTTLLNSKIAQRDRHLLQPLEAAIVRSQYDPVTQQSTILDRTSLYFKPTNKVILAAQGMMSKLDAFHFDLNAEETWFLRNIAKYSPTAQHEYSSRNLKIGTEQAAKFITDLKADVEAGRKFLDQHASGTFQELMRRIDDALAGSTMYGGVNAADFDIVLHNMWMKDTNLETISKKQKFIELIQVSRAVNESAKSHTLESQVNANLTSQQILDYNKGAHRAIDDAIATSHVAGAYAKQITSSPIDTTTLQPNDMIAKIVGDADVPRGVYKVQKVGHHADGTHYMSMQNVFDAKDEQTLHGRNFTELESKYLRGWEYVDSDARAKEIYDNLVFDDRRRAFLKDDYDTLASMEKRARHLSGESVLEADAKVMERYNQLQDRINNLARRLEPDGRGDVSPEARRTATEILSGHPTKSTTITKQYLLSPIERAMYTTHNADHIKATAAAIQRTNVDLATAANAQKLRMFAQKIGLDPQDDAQTQALVLSLAEAQDTIARARGFKDFEDAKIDIFQLMDDTSVQVNTQKAQQKIDDFAAKYNVSQAEALFALQSDQPYDLSRLVQPTEMLDDTDMTLLRNANILSQPQKDMSSRQRAAGANRAGGIIDSPEFKAKKQLLEDIEDLKAMGVVDDTKGAQMIQQFNERIKALGAKPKRRMDKVVSAGVFGDSYGRWKTKGLSGKELMLHASSPQAARNAMWGAVGTIVDDLQQAHPQLAKAQGKARNIAINEILIPQLEKSGVIPTGMANQRGSFAKISRILAKRGKTSHVMVEDPTGEILRKKNVSKKTIEGRIHNAYVQSVAPVLNEMNPAQQNQYRATKHMREKLGYIRGMKYTQPIKGEAMKLAFSENMLMGQMDPDGLLTKAREINRSLLPKYDQQYETTYKTRHSKDKKANLESIAHEIQTLRNERKQYMDELKRRANPGYHGGIGDETARRTLGLLSKDKKDLVMTSGKYASMTLDEIMQLKSGKYEIGKRYLDSIYNRAVTQGPTGQRAFDKSILAGIEEVLGVPEDKRQFITEEMQAEMARRKAIRNVLDQGGPIPGPIPGPPAPSPTAARQFLDTGFGKAALAGGALLLAAYMLGQFTNQGPLAPEQRPRRPDQIPQTDGRYEEPIPQLQQPDTSHSAVKLEPSGTGLSGMRFRVSAKNDRHLSSNETSNIVAQAAGQQTNININRRDNMADISAEWIRGQFTALLNRGYIH